MPKLTMRDLVHLVLALCLLLLALGLAAALLAAPAARADDIGPVIYVAGASLDLVSTEYALSHGATEANPLMRGTAGKRMAIKAALTTGVIFLDRKVRSKGARWGIRAAWILGHAWVARNNFRAGRNSR